MTQAALARRAGVSRKWVSEFEAGKPTAEFGLVMRVLDALGLELDFVRRSSAQGRDVDLDDVLDEYRWQ